MASQPAARSNPKSGAALPDADATGNVVNAKRVAGSRANALIKSRNTIFAKLPLKDDLATANINHIFQLANGVFAIVLYEKKLMVGQVVTFYEKGGEKASRHSWVSNASSIGAVSWISMRLWLPLSTPNSFRSLTRFGLRKFGLVHSKVFLYALKTNKIITRGDGFMKLDAAVYNSVFRPLSIKEGLVVETLMGRKHSNDLKDSE